MRRSVVLALAFAGTAGCSYIFELPASDVSPTTPDAAVGADAGDDAPLGDATPAFDAPPVVPFCASQTAPSLYCNDFDSVPAPDVASIGAAQVTGGQLLLSNAVALSPPRSVLSSVRGTSSTAAVTRALGIDTDGVTLSFDLLVSAWGTTDAQLSQIELADATAQCFVRLDGTATTWSVTQVCTANGAETAKVTTSSTSPILRGRWQRFALGVRVVPTKTVTLDVDGVRVVDVVGVDALKRAPTSIALGTKLVPTGNVTMFQDNVLVTGP